MYKIKKVDHKITDIKDKAWETAEDALVCTDNWGKNVYTPKMIARVLYSEYGLHVKMTTDEDNLVATYRNQNSDVCSDSCMEFFFRANENDPRYFNFEFNPFGTMYMSTRTSRADFHFPDVDKRFFEVESCVEPEEWSIMFSVPFDFIDCEHGGHTKKLYGNFYKCGGTRKHFLTYYPIVSEAPDFHRPECFGEFELE